MNGIVTELEYLTFVDEAQVLCIWDWSNNESDEPILSTEVNEDDVQVGS